MPEIFLRAANVQETLASLLLQVHKDLFTLSLSRWAGLVILGRVM